MFKNLNMVVLGTLLMLFIAVPATVMARNSAKFRIDQTLLLEGNKIQSGLYDVKFVPNKQEATVTFKLHRKVAAVVEGKIVASKKPYEYDATVLGKDASGHEVLRALQFSGEKFQIIFE